MKLRKRTMVVIAAVVALTASTIGLLRHSSADDVLSQLGIDQYASDLASVGVTLSPALSTPSLTAAQAVAACGSNFPTATVPATSAYLHVHVTGFGWGPPGSQDQDAWVFAVNPTAMQGPSGVEHVDTPSTAGTPPYGANKDAWVLWIEGIPDPGGRPCWGFGMGPAPS